MRTDSLNFGRQITRRDLAIALWEGLDCESVGTRELEQIQRSIAERFGERAVESPAALARILADDGARLRHPEVLAADAKWRQGKLLTAALQVALKWSSLTAAAGSIAALERLRRESVAARDDKRLGELRVVVLGHKQDRLLIAGSPILPAAERAKAREIAGWLDVWLRTPELFADWLELRRRAPEFLRRFGPPG